MTSHEPATSIAAIYAQVASEYVHVPGNGDEITEETIKRILAAEDEDVLADQMPTGDDLQRRWLRQRLNVVAKSNQSRVKDRMLAGQTVLALGVELDLVLTVCGPDALAERGLGNGHGRKTTLGLLNADDCLLMGRESALNAERITAADRSLQRVLARTVPDLARFANYGQAFQQGAAS